jgi:O-antigen/teichoic acid export membrane protein
MITVRLLGLGMGIAALLLLGGPVGDVLGLPLLGEYAAAIAILLAGQVLIELTMGVAYARLHSRVVAIARLTGQLTALGFFVAAAWLGWADPVTAALAATLSYLLSTAILGIVDMIPLVVAGPSEPMPLGPVRSFALAAWAANIFIFALAGQIDVLLLGALGKGAVEIAMYGVATLVFLRLSVLLSGWANTALASFAEVRARRGRDWAASLFTLYLRAHVLLALLVYPPIILMSGPVVELVFGAQYASAAGLMSLFGVFWLLCSFFFAGIPYALLLALGRQRDAMLVRAWAGALNLALDLLLIPFYGALGAIIATGVANVIAFAADFVLAARETGVSYPWSPVLRLSAAAAVAAGPVWLLSASSGLQVAGGGLVMALLAGVAYCATFAGMLFLVKPFSGSDLGLLSRLSPGVARLLARVTRDSEG